MTTEIEELIDTYFSGTGVSDYKAKSFAMAILRRAATACDNFACGRTSSAQELIAYEFDIDVRDLQ